MDEAAKIAAAVKAAEEAKDAEAAKKLAEKDEQIKKLGEKDTNFEKVRKQAEEAEAKAKVAEEKAAAAEKARKEAEDKLPKLDEISKRMLDAVAGKDEKFRAALEKKFNEIKGNAATPEDIEKAVKDAYTIEKGEKPKAEDVTRMTQAAGGGNRVAPVNSDIKDIDPKVLQFADEFNKHITDPKLKLKPEDFTNPKFKIKPGQSAESV